ncbi:MAG: hypothetical protein DWQ01_03690 [Planctomycetota bacterium]|nr:MAG: hypothetical protein DWQ01_03690 [Planctomycetota bacterium]
MKIPIPRFQPILLAGISLWSAFSSLSAQEANGGGVWALDGALLLAETERTWQISMPGVLAVRDAQRMSDGGWQILYATAVEDFPGGTDALHGTDLQWCQLDRDGQMKQRCLVTDTRVVDARLSPRGDRLAYWDTGLTLHRLSLPDGTWEGSIPAAADPAFSADGRWLWFSQWPIGDKQGVPVFPGPCHLQVMDLTTGQQIPWSSGSDDVKATPVSDWGLLFTSGRRSGMAGFWLTQKAMGAATPITNFATDDPNSDWVPVSDGRMSLGPDGHRVAYGCQYDGHGEVWLLDLVDRRARKLADGRQPAWLSDGSLIFRGSGATRDQLLCWDPMTGEIEVMAGGLQFREDPLRQMRRARETRTAPMAGGGVFAPPSQAGVPGVLQALDLTHQVAGGTTFRLPLASNPGYTAYYDNDAGGGVLDWVCGSFSYNGHRGTDFGTPRWTPVYAGADGTVSSRCDGFGDGWIGNTDCGGFGNMLKLNHGDSSTIYAHLQANTVSTASALACSQSVGQSGNSGNSSGPHLHFEVQKYGYPYDDPFAGTCSGAESFWTHQNGGWPTGDCQGGSGNTTVIDNEQSGFALHGPAQYWWLATGVGYGGSTRWTYNIPSMPWSNAASWTFNTAAKRFQVQVHVPSNYATTQGARYYLKTGGSWMGPYTVNQNIYYDQWVSLGTFNFRNGNNIVALIDVTGEANGSRRVAADAVRIVEQ